MSRKFSILALLILFGGIYGYIYLDNKPNKAIGTTLLDKYTKSNVVKEVRVEKLSRDNLEESIRLEGMVSPEDVYNIHTEVPLTIGLVLVKEGDQVRKGQKLLSFDDNSRIGIQRDIESIELDLRNANLEMRNLSTGTIKIGMDNKTLEMKELTETISTINKKLSVAKFEMKTLKEEARVKEDLLKEGGISSTSANEARMNASQKELEYEELKTQLGITRQKYDLARLAYSSLQKELYFKRSSLENNISKLRLALEQKRGELSKIRTEILAPIDGVVIDVLAQNGGIADPKIKLVSIAPVDKLIVKVQIPVKYSKNVEEGMMVNVSTREDRDNMHNGRITNVSNIAKEVEGENYIGRMVEAIVKLDSIKGFTPGEIVDVELMGIKKDGILAVNSFSVFQENGKNYVYVVEDGTVVKEEIEIGAKTLSKYEILNLPEGAEIVVNPFKVKDGEALKIKRD